MADDAPLSRRALNRALLARQCLLDRADGDAPGLLERVGGIQAQYAPSMYVGTWTRLAGFRRDTLTALLERRAVVQATLMRATIHLVSADDYWPMALAVRDARRTMFLRARKDTDVGAMEKAADTLRAALAEGPIRRAEIDGLLDPAERTGVGLWLDLVRVPPSGTWERRRADLFGLAEDWLGPPPLPPDEGSAEEGMRAGMELLVRRYLAGFGPATRADVASFVGAAARDVTPALDRLELRHLRGEDGAALLDLPGAPLPDPARPAPVRFLPTWDATLLVHARRTGILPEEYRPRIFSTRTPHSFPTVLVDGAVAGTWRYQDGRVAVEEFAPLPRSVRREVDEEAERLAAFHA